ncbi:MAG: alpha/beta fold hydrolase [Candidatus Kerfeldbacteria bacterium]|nr:alpha/beta fold hydrolase [Candidatus Kerfeldbacteria bacterium]
MTSTPPLGGFWLPGGTQGILLIHGYGGTIEDFRDFGAQLQSAGFSVYAMLVAGHGADVATLRRATMSDWTGSVDRALGWLQTKTHVVGIMGTSFGGALALEAASRHPEIDAVVAINTPVGYGRSQWGTKLLLRLLRLWTPYLRKPGLQAADRQRYERQGWLTAWPISGLLETYRFIEQKFLPALPHIKARVLLMQSGRDEYIRRDSAMVIGKKYGRPPGLPRPNDYGIVKNQVYLCLFWSQTKILH